MSFLQQFHLVIKYKKGVQNKVTDLLPKAVVNALLVMKKTSLALDSYVELFANDDKFKEVYDAFNKGIQKGVKYHLHTNILYHLGQICVPKDERVNVIQESHKSLISGHFKVGKIVEQLQIYCYWPRIQEKVSKYIKGCVLYSTRKPSNRKLGLYTPFLVPLKPWESVSMDFWGGFPSSKIDHDYLYVVVDMFNNMCSLIPCKKQVTTGHVTQLFFTHVWVHFGLPSSIVYDRDSIFLGNFCSCLWELMDTKLYEVYRISSIDRWTNTSCKLDSGSFTQRILGKHPNMWDEQLTHISLNLELYSKSKIPKEPKNSIPGMFL